MAGYGERPCAKCGTIIPDNVGGILGAAGHANGPGPFCSVACWQAPALPEQGAGYEAPAVPRPPAVPEHIWLGDLSGWSISGVDSDGRAFINHRCGYAAVFAPHDNFLGNITEWVSQHREDHACADWYRRYPSQSDWMWSPEEQRAVYRPIPRTPDGGAG